MKIYLFCTLQLVLIDLSQEVITFTQAPSDAVVRERSRVSVECGGKTSLSDGDLVITWKRNESWIQSDYGEHFKILSNGTLVFATFLISDQGRYQCSALVIKDGKTIEQKLSRVAVLKTAYIRESFKSSPSLLQVRIGDTAYLQCISPKSLPLPVLIWEKDGGKLDGYHNESTVLGSRLSSTLQISNFAYTDAGYYRCSAYNPLLPEKFIHAPYFPVNIQVEQAAPYFLHEPAMVIAARYRPTIMHCLILGDPLPSINWQKGGVHIANDTNHGILSNGSLFFRTVDNTDGGDYTCAGNNTSGSIHSHVAPLIVAFIDYDFVVNPKDKVALVGNLFTLKCAPPNSFPKNLEITWFKDFQQLSVNARRKVQPNGTLVILVTEISDGGHYFCQAFNGISMESRASQPATVTIHALPVLGVSKRSLSIIQGRPLHINCNSSGIPTPTTTLYKIENNILTILSKKGIFQVSSATKLDAGLYRCVAENVEGVAEHDMEVSVLIPPKISTSPSNTSLLVGERLVLSCEYNGHPRPAVHWEFTNWKNVVNNVSSLEKVTAVTADRLVIFKVRKLDEGWYACIAESEAGYHKSTAFVSILVPPVIRNITAKVTVKSLGSIFLSCTVMADPDASVYWQHNGSTVVHGHHYNLNTQRKKAENVHLTILLLSINKTILTDSGEYSCYGKSRIGSAKRKTYIEVQVPPTITSFTVANKLVVGDEIHIQCQSFAIPSAYIQLQHNGSEFVAEHRMLDLHTVVLTKIIQNITLNESGRYVCRTQNSLGDDQRLIDVTVKDYPNPPMLKQPVVLSSSGVVIFWSLSFNGYSPLQVIVLEASSSGSWGVIDEHILPTVLKYHVKNLLPYTMYSFRLKVKNEVGFSGYSNVVQMKTLAGAPSPPLDIHFYSKSARSVLVSWRQPRLPNGEIRIFQLYLSGHVNVSINHTVATQLDVYNHLLTGLSPSTEYRLKLRGATQNRSMLNWGDFSSNVRFLTDEDVINPTSLPGSTVNDSVVNVSTTSMVTEYKKLAVKNWLDGDYLVILVVVSSFAVCLLFGILVAAFARCWFGQNKKEDYANGKPRKDGNHMPLDAPRTPCVKDYIEDLIFEDDTYETVVGNPNIDSNSNRIGKYKSVEPYQGQRVGTSPLVKLKGSDSSMRSSTPVNDVSLESYYEDLSGLTLGDVIENQQFFPRIKQYDC